MLAASWYHIHRTITLKAKELAGLLLPPLLASLSVGLCWSMVSMFVNRSSMAVLSLPAVALAIKLSVGLAAYAAVYRLSQPLNHTGIDFKILWAALKQNFKTEKISGAGT
jgi:hypothetical protein